MLKSKKLSDEEILFILNSSTNVNEAIKALYAVNYFKLESYILRNKGSKEDAEDVIQETMVAFINIVQQGKFKGESSIATFLGAIARNIWLEKLRKLKAEMQKRENWKNSNTTSFIDLNLELQRKEATDLIAQLFIHLGETCQKLLKLFYFEELPMKDILPLMAYENEQVLRNKKAKCMKALLEQLQSKPQWAAMMKTALKNVR